MAVVGVVTGVENLQKHIRRIIALTFSGNYSTGGDTLDLTALTAPGETAGLFHRNPSKYRVANAVVAGFLLEIVPGTSLTTWKIKVYRQDGSTGALVELAAAAVPAGLTGATNAVIELEERAS